MCDFTAQAQQHFLGYIIQFGTNLVWIVVLIIGIIVACCKSASGVLCVMIVATVLFVVQIAGGAIVSAAPNNVMIAFFLWAGAALPDWNGNPTVDDDPSGASSWADPLWNCNDNYLATSEAFLQTSSTIQWVFGALFLCVFLHIWFTAYMTMKDIKTGVAGTGTGKPSHNDGVVMGVATAKPSARDGVCVGCTRIICESSASNARSPSPQLAHPGSPRLPRRAKPPAGGPTPGELD